MAIKRSDIIFLGLCVVCIGIFFHQPLTSDVTFFFRDLFHWTYPLKQFLSEEISNHRLPLWNPYVDKGIPYAANPASSLYYPFNMVFLALPFSVALKSFLILHYLLLAIFTYLFLRNLRLPPPPSLVGAVTFSLSGYVLFLHSQSVFLQSAIWLPLNLLLFTRSLATHGDGRWVVLTALGIAIQFLAGNPQDVLIALLCMLALGLHWISFHTPRLAAAKTLLACFVRVGVLSAGFAAVQLLPAVELAGLSTRASGLPYHEAVYYSFHPLRLIELLLPLPFGTLFPHKTYWGQQLINSSLNIPWTLHAYLGIVPLFFVLLAVVRNHRPHRIFVFLAALFLLLSFGKHTAVFGFFFHIIPGFSLFRYPEKYLLPTTLCLATLCAVGCDTFLSLVHVRRRLTTRPLSDGRPVHLLRAYTAVQAAASLFVAATTLGYLGLSLFDSVLPRILRWLADTQGLAPFPPLASATLLQSLNHFVVFGLISFVIIYCGQKFAFAPRRYFSLVLLVLVSDLFFANRTLITYTSYRIYESTPALVDALKAQAASDRTPYRIFRARIKYSGQYEREILPFPAYERQRWWDKNTLVKNLANVYHFSYVDSYEAVELSDYLDFLNSLDHNLNRLLSLLNVRYVIAPIGDPKYAAAAGYSVLLTMPREGIALLRNNNCYARAFIVPKAFYAPQKATLLSAITQNDFDFRTTVALEAPAPSPAPGAPAQAYQSSDHCTILDYTPCYIKIDAAVARASYLVLSDTYYPGWKASVDGTAQPILKANYVMRALLLQPGRHIVEFNYDPISFKAGLTMSLLTILLAAFLLFRHKGPARSEPLRRRQNSLVPFTLLP